jgi:hypothetical protein
MAYSFMAHAAPEWRGPAGRSSCKKVIELVLLNSLLQQFEVCLPPIYSQHELNQLAGNHQGRAVLVAAVSGDSIFILAVVTAERRS